MYIFFSLLFLLMSTPLERVWPVLTATITITTIIQHKHDDSIISLASLVVLVPLYFVFVRSPCCPNSARPAVPTSILHEAKLQKSAFFCNNDSSAVQLAPGHRLFAENFENCPYFELLWRITLFLFYAACT